MKRVDEARKKLAWALEHQRSTFHAEIGDGFLNAYQSPIRFTKEEKVCNVAVDFGWVDDCIPESGYITPELRGLLKEVERELG